MLIDKLIHYDKKYYIEVNKNTNSFYYFFDYDERSYDINMEFQHFHPFYEIHILLDDSANHIIEGIKYSMKKLDITCLKPNLLHKSEYPVGPPVKRIIIQFSFPIISSGMQTELEEVLNVFQSKIPIYRFNRTYQEKILVLLNDIFRASKLNNEMAAHLLIHSKFIEFLTTLYMYQDKNCYIPEVFDTLSNKIYSITSYIHNHFSEDISLNTLAKHFYISTFYLSHQFKEVTGFTLTNYIQMTRIRYAQQMLLSSDKKITDIASECGFTSFSQFNRVFNKFCHSSPREFKASSIKNQI